MGKENRPPPSRPVISHWPPLAHMATFAARMAGKLSLSRGQPCAQLRTLIGKKNEPTNKVKLIPSVDSSELRGQTSNQTLHLELLAKVSKKEKDNGQWEKFSLTLPES